jgi:hypothetical protein
MWKDFTWNYKLQVKFHIWIDFTWNYKWHFTCERIRLKDFIFKWNYKLQSEILHVRERIKHEIINYNEISHVKGFHMKLKLQVKFHMRKDFIWSKKVKFHMWKISHEVKSEEECERNSHKATSEISYVIERISHER